MLNIGQTRLRKELADLERDPPPGIVCYPIDDSDITHLESYVKGPPDSPYEQGTFRLDIIVPQSYPFDPPQMRFKTKIYHPNIDDAGRICADILKKGEHGGWKPSLNLSTTLISLRSLLSAPNPDDPLDADIAREYKLDYARFVCKAKEFTTRYATGDSVEEDSTDICTSKNIESTEQQKDEPSSSNQFSETASQDKGQKGKKSLLSLSSRKRKKPSSDQQCSTPEPYHCTSPQSENQSPNIVDEPPQLQHSPTTESPTEDTTPPASSSIETVSISSQEPDTIITTATATVAAAVAEKAVPLSPVMTASQPFSNVEEPENADVKTKHKSAIPSMSAVEAEPALRHVPWTGGENGNDEISAPSSQRTPCIVPGRLQNVSVNIIDLDPEPEKNPGMIKKKNKLSLSRTKRQKTQN